MDAALTLPLARLALVLGLGGAAAVLCWAVARASLLPNPVAARSNHAVPVSRAGGAVVLSVFALGVALVWFAASDVLRGTSGLVAAVIAAGLTGLADDVHTLGPTTKLCALTVIAAVTAGAVGPLGALPLPLLGWVGLPSGLGYALAALWVLGFVNVFNFLDGLNGMAAGTGVVLLAGLAAAGGADGGLLALCMMGALLGFALPNVLGGKPFLGDAGSLSIGTLIAGAALEPGGEAIWLVVCGGVPFLADAIITMIRRARRGDALTEAHSDHAYQRLHRAGWSHQAVALAYAGLAGSAVAASVALGADEAWRVLALIACTFAAWWGTVRAMFARKG